MSRLSRLLMVILSFLPFSFACFSCTAQQLTPLPNFQPEWVRDFTPFRTGLPGSDTMIRKHVEALGFKFKDMKILLATHAHFDHVGAMAAIRQSTRAKMMIEEKDAPVLADGGNSDFIFGGKGPIFLPVKADRLLHDHDTVKLGGMEILVLHHPGHTKGACSFLFTVRDDKRSWQVLIANIPTILDATRFPGMPAYPNVMKDYAYTLDTMPKLKFDLWFASHAGQFDRVSETTN